MTRTPLSPSRSAGEHARISAQAIAPSSAASTADSRLGGNGVTAQTRLARCSSVMPALQTTSTPSRAAAVGTSADSLIGAPSARTTGACLRRYANREPTTRRTDGRPDATREPDREGEDLEAAQQGGEPDRDARLFVRAAASALAERQARHRGRRHLQEAAADADGAAGAERREARDPGAAGAGGEPRGSRAAGARAQ